jgi:hypothetical protein
MEGDLEVEVVGDVDAIGEHQLVLDLQEAHAIAGLELALLDPGRERACQYNVCV